MHTRSIQKYSLGLVSKGRRGGKCQCHSLRGVSGSIYMLPPRKVCWQEPDLDPEDKIGVPARGSG